MRRLILELARVRDSDVYVYVDMAAVVDRFEYKRLVLKAIPRVGNVQESKENSFWKKFKVRVRLCMQQRSLFHCDVRMHVSICSSLS